MEKQTNYLKKSEELGDKDTLKQARSFKEFKSKDQGKRTTAYKR